MIELCARRKQLVQMQCFLRSLRREVRCSAAPLNVVLKNLAETLELPLLDSFDFSYPFDLSVRYPEAKKRAFDEMFFRKKDWEWADRLFHSLGEGDLAEQDRHLSFCEEGLCSLIGDASATVGRNGKLALVLGGSFGAMLVLLLL